MTDEIKTIDITPTWAALVPIFVAVLQDGTEAGKREAIENLMQLARGMDRANEHFKGTQAVTVLIDGEPNFYTFSKPGDWIARIQFNGKYLSLKQMDIAEKIAAHFPTGIGDPL